MGGSSKREWQERGQGERENNYVELVGIVGKDGTGANECHLTNSPMEIGSVQEQEREWVGEAWVIAQVQAEDEETDVKAINVVGMDKKKLVKVGRG